MRITLAALALLSSPAWAGDDATGADVWAAKCAACHGATGGGDGPASGALPRKPADMTKAAFWADNTEASIRTTILKGKPGSAMRGFPMSDTQLDALYAHIQTFKPTE